LKGKSYQLALNSNKVLLILSLEIGLASLLVCCSPIIYAKVFLSFLSVFIIPTIAVTLLFVRDSIDFVKLLFLSLVISPVLIGAITLLLSVAFPPLNRLLLIAIIILLTLASSLIYVFRREKVTIVCNEAELVSLFVILIASLLVLHIIIGLPHHPTPDENYYITDARLLLNYGQASPISTGFWKESLTILFSSRIQWISIIASFIASAGISPAYSNCVSLIFLLGISTSTLLLIPERYKDHPLTVAVPMLVLLNPVLLMLSGFALNDLAVAFYNVASLIFFINSFKDTLGKIELDFKNLLIAIALQLVVVLIKFNVIFIIPYFLVLTINTLRFKLYQSKTGKAVTIFVILPVLMYELILDIPRNLALYGLKTRALEFLSSFLPVSPVETLILMFVSVPYSPRTMFDYTAIDYLWRFYTVLSPENLSIFVASIAIFLPFLLKRTSGDVKFKNMIAITLLAMLVQYLFALSTGGWGDIPRYYACLIAPLTVASLILYLDWISNKPHMMLLPLIGMLLLVWSNYVLTEGHGGVVISWGLANLNKTLNILMLQTVAYASLVLALFFLQRNKIVLVTKSLRNKMKFLRLRVDKLILAVLLLFAVLSNFYFSVFAYANSPSFSDHGLVTVTNEADQGIIFSNSYAIGTYASNNLFRNGFISSMPPAEEFDDLIRNMPNGTKLIFFTNPRVTGLSESFVSSYPRTLAGREFILPSDAAPCLTEIHNVDSILHANFMNRNCNVTIDNFEVEARFNNVSWIEYHNCSVPYFNCSESFIEIPYSSSLNFTPPYTIETWVVYEKTGKDAPLVDFSMRSGGYLLLIRDGKVWFVNGFGNNAYTTKLTVNENVWTHIVVSFNGTHSTFYINTEKEVVTGPEFRPLNETPPMWIGRRLWAPTMYYKGIIGVINIYNRSLNDEEALSNYMASFKMPYLKLCEKVSSSTGDAFVYEILSPTLLNTGSSKDIKANCVSWSVANFSSAIPDIVLSLNVSSQKHCNITIVLSNDAFSRILSSEIHPGNNTIALKFESKQFISGRGGLSPYGSIIARNSNILVMDDENNIILRGVTSIFQYSPLQLVGYALIGLTVTLLSLFLATHVEALDRGKKDSCFHIS